MLYNYIELDVFRTAIQRLTFTNSISLYSLCDLAFAKEDLDKYGQEFEGGVVGDDYVANERKYGNILKRLCIDKNLELTPKELLAQPKVYDQYMLKSQVNLYNTLAPKINYPPIDIILPFHMLEELSFLDDITKAYPYYPDKNRDGCNFIELILLLNIRLTLRGHSLFTLDKKPESSYDKKKAINMVNKLVANMKTEKMFKLYVYTFFDTIEEIAHKKHIELAEKAMRIALLPDSLKNRIDVFDSFERYRKRFVKNLDIDYSECGINLKMISENSNDSQVAYDRMAEFSYIDLIASELLPMAFHILIGSEKEMYISEFPEKNKLAKEYAKTIKSYINKAISETVSILNKLYTKTL